MKQKTDPLKKYKIDRPWINLTKMRREKSEMQNGR
jgi:hypothetical protein